jgi:alkanesulfonate monooxygenase SsuD/methylene tetrahydromethanopterin reductase-like flavin-dependent oxidoreductase (luciferase family)
MSTALRFGVYVLPDAPFPTLAERWRLVEDLGFDQLWTADHSADWRHPTGHWFDGWTTLAAMATSTSRIRLGTLVSNPILRHPVILAKQASAVDHLCSGRLELGIGTGIAGFDHAAMGGVPWSPRERVERFQEYVRIVHDLLTSSGSPVTAHGRHYSTDDVRLIPPPFQQPRPPITIGGQSPSVLRVAASLAERWNTHGPFGATVDEIVAITRAQNATLDELCAADARDPLTLRRALLLFEDLDPWLSPGSFERIVDRFVPTGIREFVIFWPGDDRRGDLEKLAFDVVPRLSGTT